MAKDTAKYSFQTLIRWSGPNQVPIIVRESIFPRKLLNDSSRHSKVVYKLANNPNFLFSVLSGKRCSEMSIVYDDIQAVTRLLQEKEKVIATLSHFSKCRFLLVQA